MSVFKKLVIFSAVSIIFVAPTRATNYFVDDLNGINSNAGLTPGSAKKTMQAAANLTNPGDTVFIMNGTYLSSATASQTILNITRSGTNGNYITYKAYPGHSPKIKLLSGLSYQIWRAIAINASYIVVDGIEIEGANASLNYTDAYQTWQEYENGIGDWNKIAAHNCSAISIGQSSPAHHVIVRNCNVHDAGSGIGGGNCDYITIENNLIYNNCWYTMYASSGISILDPRSIDAVTSYKIFIRNNITHNNKTLIPWEQINALSDGNGIILDVNIGTATTPPYVGRYLVENNVSYNNGGGGVHAYKAAHVDIINNTAYNNGTVVGYPEIDANQCADVNIYNNIMYARTGGNCNGNDANTIYDYNLYFNGSSFKNGPHDKTANPQFVTPATDATANLALKSISPAINNGSNVSGQFSPVDIVAIARPVGFSSDMGAYEYASVVPRNEIKVMQGTTEIVDNTGSFDFGDVASTAAKTVTFTIENIGDFLLNLTGTPRVALTGTGFSLATDAPATISSNGSATFQVTLTPVAIGGYSGTVSIANNDADENPYNFTLTGYGYDGNRILQTIIFNPIPVKVIGDADFNPGATSSAGFPVSYTSSNTAVATIVGGNIHLVNSGTSTITAFQPGDANTNPAKNVTQLLTVTPTLPPPGTNLVSNPTFDVNTTGWSFANKNGATSTVQSVAMPPSATNVGKVTITDLGSTTSSDNVQLSTNVFLIKDRNYLITFKANADAARSIGLRILQNASPFSTIFSRTINITTAQATYGFYAYTSTYTGSVALRFFLGNSSIPVYFDDVEIKEEITLPVTLLSFNGFLLDNKVVLKWETSAEINAKEFVIEKSLDGTSFSSIGKLAAKNAINGASYEFKDDKVSTGQIYYRLKTIDKDAGFKYSKIVVINISAKEEPGISIFPNPATSYVTVSYVQASKNATMEIFLNNGRKVGAYNIVAGSVQQSLDISGLSSGYYYIVYKNNGQTKTTSFVK